MLRFDLFFNHAVGEFIDFLKIIGPIRVVLMSQKVELRVHGLDLHDHFLESAALLGDIAGCLIDDGLDIRRGDDDSGLLLFLVLQICF